MKPRPAFPYWRKGPRKTERMLVQHTVPWHRTGFVLLVFHLWVQCRGERERDSASRVHCCGLCHPLNIEQNSAKRHSNSYVKIDAVLCFAFRLAAACFDIWASAGRQSHDLDIKLSNSLKKFSVFQWMSANEAKQIYLMSRKQSGIILVWINLIIGVFF